MGTIRNRAIAGLAAIVAAVGVVSALPASAEPAPQRISEVVTEAPALCQEDEPCWDCETMGNKVCGPAAEVLTDEVFTYAEAYEWCADVFFADLNARADCQWAAYRDFDDTTNPKTKIKTA